MRFVGQFSKRLEGLIEKGLAVIQTHKPNPPGVIGFPTLNAGAFTEWKSQCLAAIRSMVGDVHTYAVQFEKCVERGFKNQVEAGIGILRALREDIEGGHLLSMQLRVAADVFSDFIEMARHLLDHGYKDAAASITGAVLENGLRRISEKHGLKSKNSDDLNALNQKCAQGGVYNRMVQQQLQVWITLRNSADHGHFGDYSIEDVKSMIEGVRGFLSAHLE
jgi:hypothetical protein